MDNKENKYVYHFKSPTIDEQREIRNIKNRYVKNELDEKRMLVRRLDARVTTIPLVVALSMGIIGVLVFGFGMSSIMVWNNWPLGIICSIFGVLIMMPAYFVYKAIYNCLKNKYKDKIIELSNEILNEN